MTFPYSSTRNLLIDLDGVLYRGDTALPEASVFIQWLRGLRIPFRLVSNNSTLTPQQYVAKLSGLGMSVHAEEVFTSALATVRYLKQRKDQGISAYVIGEGGLLTALSESGFTITPDNPAWVIAGLDRGFTYEKLTLASLAIQRGAQFIGTNPDVSLPTERGLLPGAGSILAAISAATGTEPIVIGKPEPLMLQLAMQEMGAEIEGTAMLGDRLDTDILGAVNLGMRSLLVLTGVSSRKEAETGAIHPSAIVSDLPELMKQWSAAISKG